MPRSVTLKSELPRLAGFALVGGAGFLVHAGAVFVLTQFTGIGNLLAWFPAFILAVVVTWALNRILAFRGLTRAMTKRVEAGKYFAVQSAGSAINLVVYALLAVGNTAIFSRYPVAALATGSIVAFAFNYIALRKFVYTQEASNHDQI